MLGALRHIRVIYQVFNYGYNIVHVNKIFFFGAHKLDICDKPTGLRKSHIWKLADFKDNVSFAPVKIISLHKLVVILEVLMKLFWIEKNIHANKSKISQFSGKYEKTSKKYPIWPKRLICVKKWRLLVYL